MGNFKKYVIDFVEGHIKAKDFISHCEKNSEVLDWMQSIVPAGKVCYKTTAYRDDNGYISVKKEVLPYDIKVVWEQYLAQPGESDLGKQLNIHYEISRLMMEVFPNDGIKVDNTLHEQNTFLLSACPSYVGGDAEVEEFLFKVMSELPADLSKAKRIKLFKEKIKTLFHIEDRKYPAWLQEPEWPFSNGKPMRFVSQASKHRGELYEYTFEDVDTKEQKIIEQFT